MPFILSKYVSILRSDVRRSSRALNVIIRDAQKKIRVRVSRANASRPVVVEFTIGGVVENQVFLVRTKSAPEFPVVVPARPRNRIRPGECIFHVASRTVFTVS